MKIGHWVEKKKKQAKRTENIKHNLKKKKKKKILLEWNKDTQLQWKNSPSGTLE